MQEKQPNRIQWLKEHEPERWDYILRGGDNCGENGLWIPAKGGLGMKKIFDYMNIPYE